MLFNDGYRQNGNQSYIDLIIITTGCHTSKLTIQINKIFIYFLLLSFIIIANSVTADKIHVRLIHIIIVN